MGDFPLPGMGEMAVAVSAPGAGEGWWAGSSSATMDEDGSFVIAYRVRTGHAGRGSTVVARSPDGVRLTTVATLDQAITLSTFLPDGRIAGADDERRVRLFCPPPATEPTRGTVP